MLPRVKLSTYVDFMLPIDLLSCSDLNHIDKAISYFITIIWSQTLQAPVIAHYLATRLLGTDVV